jgi:hypothetical protein
VRLQAPGGEIKVTELGRYRKGGRLWVSVVIPRDLPREALIQLAKRLHQQEPDVSYRLFTDGKEYGKFAAWDQNYPSDDYPYPKGWAKKHYIAIVNLMATLGGTRRWQLYAMDAGRKYPVGDTMVIADLD